MTDKDWWKRFTDRKWSRKSLEAAGVICLLLLASGYFFIHKPLVDMEQEARQVAEKSRTDLVAVDNYQNNHMDMAAYEKELVEHQARANLAMPDSLEQGTFLGMLQQEALRNHIELKQVVPKPVQQDGNLLILPVEVKMHCDYFSLLSFLQGIKECERYIQIEHTAVHEDSGALNCSLQLRIYAWNETKETEDAE